MSRTAIFPKDEQFMRLALREAVAAGEHGDVPVGAVVVHDGEVVGTGRNERELRGDPTAHAELLALRAAALSLGGWRLPGAVLYVTLEPCPMCAGAAVVARVAEIIYGTPDPKGGAVSTLYRIASDPRLNHRAAVTSGVLAEECAALLTSFFRSRRPAPPR